MFELALSTNGKVFDEDLFRQYAECGIKAMELSLSLEECDTLDFVGTRTLADKYGVKLCTFHLPFYPFDKIDISNPELARGTVERFKCYIEAANDIGIKTFVIHASGEPIKDDRSERMECSEKSLLELAEFADAFGCTIAVEDLPRSCLGNCSSEILELVSVHPSLRVCFDTNHLLGEDVTEFIRRVGNKIVTMHVSDYDFINERHWLPGEGKVDWLSLIDTLASVGYDGYWLYEIAFETPWSIDRPRELTCTDFKDNYDMLMQGTVPAPIGRPYENLGVWKIEKSTS